MHQAKGEDERKEGDKTHKERKIKQEGKPEEEGGDDDEEHEEGEAEEIEEEEERLLFPSRRGRHVSSGNKVGIHLEFDAIEALVIDGLNTISRVKPIEIHLKSTLTGHASKTSQEEGSNPKPPPDTEKNNPQKGNLQDLSKAQPSSV